MLLNEEVPASEQSVAEAAKAEFAANQTILSQLGFDEVAYIKRKVQEWQIETLEAEAEKAQLRSTLPVPTVSNSGDTEGFRRDYAANRALNEHLGVSESDYVHTAQKRQLEKLGIDSGFLDVARK